MRDDRERPLDVSEALDRIARYTELGRERFEADELVQTWVIHHLQIIGEAARTLSPAVRERYPQVPWMQIVRMRHILAHQYFGVDVELIWSVVEQHLPALRATVSEMLPDPPDPCGADQTP